MSAKKIRRLANKEAQKIMGENLGGQQNVEEQISSRIEIEHFVEEFLESNESENERDIFNSDSDCESERNEYSTCEELGKWANQFSVSFSAFNALLRCLNKCEVRVPKDGRTILKTPTTVVQRKVGNGIYVHYGIKNALTDYLVDNEHSLPSITLDFGIDGLPLFKSSSKQVWPILGSIINTSYVFLIGVYEGISKPCSANEFLSEFISEVNVLKVDGLLFGDKCFNILVRCFVMDAPARSFILGTKGHTGYFSCVRCTDKGEMVKNRVVFPPLNNSTLRTNESFKPNTISLRIA